MPDNCETLVPKDDILYKVLVKDKCLKDGNSGDVSNWRASCKEQAFRGSRFHRRLTPGSNGRVEMTFKVSGGKPASGELGVLRGVALIALAAGAAGSVGLMLRAGHRQNSRLLLVLFTFWVLSPFTALVGANVVSRRWPVLTRATLYSVMLVVTLGTLAIYGYVALGPPRAKTAAVFVVVPPASLLLIAIVVPIAALMCGRQSHRG